MLNRWGGKEQVGFSEIEEIWLTAANTLQGHERTDALIDICQMVGRQLYHVREKANKMRRLDKIAVAEMKALVVANPPPRAVLVAVRRHTGFSQPITPGDFIWPSKASMTGRRASTRRVREVTAD